MTTDGYYRFPTLYKNDVVFVSEDDLWRVSSRGGVPWRLTANLGRISDPAFSPTGKWLAFVGREEGRDEVYLMPAQGGPAKRLTYLGGGVSVLGWTPDSKKIIFSSSAGQPFNQLTMLYNISPEGGQPELLPYGPARSISFGPQNGVVLGRHAQNLAYWKRYRGGRAGDIWIDLKGKGRFKPLLKLKSNLIRPIWLKDRIYFLSDHEGVGNLYSCTLRGTKVQRHTHHENFYIRQPASDAERIIYTAGGDLYIFDPAQQEKGKAAVEKINIQFHSPRVQRNRKFIKASGYLGHYSLHPKGHSITLTVRGKAFSCFNWDGAVFQYGEAHGTRYRLSEWLNDGNRLVMISDTSGEEVLEIHANAALATTKPSVERLAGLDIGRPTFIKVSPQKDELILANHRCELIYVDLSTKTAKVLDKSDHGRIMGVDWSPDGRWVAYGYRTSIQSAAIKLYNFEQNETHYLTPPNSQYDYGPSFDPDGKYLYFISYRDFDPVYDSHYFDLNFPRGSRPYLVSLQKDLPYPFNPQPNHKADSTGRTENKNGQAVDKNSQAEAHKKDKKQSNKRAKPLQIDLDDIQARIVRFPVNEGLYQQVRGVKDKVYFSSRPIQGSLNQSAFDKGDDGKGILELYDFKEYKKEHVVNGVSSFDVCRDKKFLMYRANKNLRVLKVGDKPDNNAVGYTKKSGWIKINRFRVAISPPDEWRQMFREAWRLQRDNFWTEDMSSINWETVYERYYPLLERVATRSEFSDLLWEMQGELGTSHAYELGGDYRSGPNYRQGFLGVDFEYDAAHNGYRLTHIVQGDSWRTGADSPLHRLGVNAKVGDIVLSINGEPLGPDYPPQLALLNRANVEIQLTIVSATETDVAGLADGAANNEKTTKPRTVLVKTLADETQARYREWVENKCRLVHEKSEGRVGYVHIPDMGPMGYAEFHRYYRVESEYEGLIVDVRFNGGGHVSQLLLEKLGRRRWGYRKPRYGQVFSYPRHSVLGPIVALSNEYASSDGDIFSHVFKLMKLGQLIGKRTWGGVVGIWPRYSLVDGTQTTQPEISSWFEDVGWGVENYGTDPDIEIDIKPQDYATGKDPQLQCALKEILNSLAENPPQIPDFGPEPRLTLPKLPPLKKKK